MTQSPQLWGNPAQRPAGALEPFTLLRPRPASGSATARPVPTPST